MGPQRSPRNRRAQRPKRGHSLGGHRSRAQLKRLKSDRRKRSGRRAEGSLSSSMPTARVSGRGSSHDAFAPIRSGALNREPVTSDRVSTRPPHRLIPRAESDRRRTLLAIRHRSRGNPPNDPLLAYASWSPSTRLPGVQNNEITATVPQPERGPTQGATRTAGVPQLARLGLVSWRRHVAAIATILFFWFGLGTVATIAVATLTGTYDPLAPRDGFSLSGYLLINVPFPFLLTGLAVAVRFIHHRPLRSLITPRARVDFRRVLQGF